MVDGSYPYTLTANNSQAQSQKTINQVGIKPNINNAMVYDPMIIKACPNTLSLESNREEDVQ